MKASGKEFLGAVIKQVDPDHIVDVLEAFHDLDLLPSESELEDQSGDDDRAEQPESDDSMPTTTPGIGGGIDLSDFSCYYLPRYGLTSCIHRKYIGGPPGD